jgi:serine/threonine protein phosphatase PrpC
VLCENPKQFIRGIANHIENKLSELKGVDTVSSGSTGIFVVEYKGTLFCGSVGDSRAIIGTTLEPDTLPTPTAKMHENERLILEDAKEARKVSPYKRLFSV